MSIKIETPPATHRAAPSTAAKSQEDAAKVGHDFEAILVRQMLSHMKIAGKGGGYADMAVEALATSISQAGGLGMGRIIERALSGSHSQVPHDAPPVPPRRVR